jgi:hypothetical protein
MSASQFPPIYTSVPTSPVYTPHKQPSALRTALRPEDAMQPLHIDSLAAGMEPARPTSLVSEDISEGSSNSSIISPLFDSFPSVPTSTSPSLPESPFLQGHGHDHLQATTTRRPTLPVAAPSFFDAAPLSSAVVGAEFLPGPSPVPPMSFDWQH